MLSPNNCRVLEDNNNHHLLSHLLSFHAEDLANAKKRALLTLQRESSMSQSTTPTIPQDSVNGTALDAFLKFSETAEYANKRARASSPSEGTYDERKSSNMQNLASVVSSSGMTSLSQQQAAAAFRAAEREHLLRELTLTQPALMTMQKPQEALNIRQSETERSAASSTNRWGQASAANMGASSAAGTSPHFAGAAGIPLVSDTNKLAELMRLRAMLGQSGRSANRPESTFPEPTSVGSLFHHGLSNQQAQLEALLALQAQSRAQNIRPFYMPPSVASSSQFTGSSLNFSPTQTVGSFASMQGPFADYGLSSLVRNSSGNVIPSAAGGGLDASSILNMRNQFQNALSGSNGLVSNPAISPAMLAASGAAANVARQHALPTSLPVILARDEDDFKLSSHQVFLRHQIEVFQATEEDVTTHTRGRNKPITLGQVGIRCKHCSHMPVSRRQKGSTYFPASLLGLYQAAQNMSTTHMQCGLCTEMPLSTKQQFAQLLNNKSSSSGAGRPYWAKTAAKIGLVDTEDGIRFYRGIPAVFKLVETDGL